MKRFLLAVIASAALFPWSAALADGVGIEPTNVKIDATHRIVTVTIANNDPVVHTFQITPFAWTQRDGEDELQPTNDLLVSPPIFSLIAGGQQSVRFALRNPVPVAGELTYRILLRTAPSDTVPLGSGLRMRMSFSVPVFIASPQGGAAKLSYVYRDLGHGHVQLRIENTGTAHVRVVHVRLADAHGTPVDAPAADYILAGTKATMDLSASRPIVGETVNAKVTFDAGPPVDVVIHRAG